MICKAEKTIRVCIPSSLLIARDDWSEVLHKTHITLPKVVVALAIWDPMVKAATVSTPKPPSALFSKVGCVILTNYHLHRKRRMHIVLHPYEHSIGCFHPFSSYPDIDYVLHYLKFILTIDIILISHLLSPQPMDWAVEELCLLYPLLY